MLSLELILAKLAELAMQSQQGKDAAIILQWAIAELRSLLRVDRVLLYQCVTQSQAIVVNESVAEGNRQLLGRSVSIQALPATEVILQSPITHGGVNETAPIDILTHVSILSELQGSSRLGIPVFSQGNLWGVLAAYHYSATREWQPLEVQLLQHFALQLGPGVVRRITQLEGVVQKTEPNSNSSPSVNHAFEEVLLREIINTSPLAFYVVDNRTDEILCFNHEFCRIWQIEHLESPMRRGELKNNDLISACLCLIADTPAFIESCKPLQSETNGVTIADEIGFKDGRVIRRFSSQIRDQNNRYWGRLYLFEDITRHKQLEKQLQLQNIAMLSCADTIMITDRNGLIEWVNPAFTQMTGYPWQETIGKNPRELVKSNQHDAAFYQGMWQTILAGQVWRGEVINQRKDGRLYCENMTITPIYHQQQQISHFIAIKQDVTEKKKLQQVIDLQQVALYQQMQKSNAQLESLVQERTLQLQRSLKFEVLLKRITDRVRDSLDKNQILQTVVVELTEGLQLLGCDSGIYNLEQTQSTIVYEYTKFFHSAQGCSFRIADAPYAEVYPQLFQRQICHFSGYAPNPGRTKLCPLTILAVPIWDDHRILGDLWLFRPSGDVFDEQEIRLVQQVANQCAIALRQSRLYQIAQTQVQELERMHRLKDDFLNTVSHELRTPITAIKMATYMLQKHLDSLGLLDDSSGVCSRYITMLHEQGQRELSLINNLLDLARLDVAEEPLHIEPLNPKEVIPLWIAPFYDRAQQQQQQLLLCIDDALPPFETDISYLERILTELLHNACKYTPAQETITLSIYPSLSAAQTGLEIRVVNTGVEIPVAEHERIFDKFYRIPHHDPWKYGGTGLGLALVKKLTERLGGKIRLESGHQQTTFILEFYPSLHDASAVQPSAPNSDPNG